VELAETLGAPVYDVNSRLNFPSRHPLNLSMVKDVFADADLVLCLDTRDWERATTRLVSATREVTSIVPAGARWIDIGFGDLELSSWAMDYQRLAHADLRILADTTLAIPALTGLIKKGGKRPLRKELVQLRDAARARWEKEAKEDWDASPVTLPRLATEVWNAIKDEDWVLSANTLEDWTRKIWDFDRPYRHPGKSLGTATQIGISLGVALATATPAAWWWTCSPTAT
jgi:acetolactate synthase-1/2/3 large subunit